MKRFIFGIVILGIALSLFKACGGTSGFEVDDEDEPEEILPTEPVAPDGILETVTWNTEWYGNEGNGPDDEFQQTKNIVRVLDSLDADLYAMQEIFSQEAFNEIVEPMTGYKGFTADFINKGQKMAFLYNTNTIDSLEAGEISLAEVRETYRDEWEYYWANGRPPLFFRFDYHTPNSEQTEFFAVVIHAKANYGDYQESYKRRQMAAEGLYYYLLDEHPNANIILMGDYNDDVDESIYYEEQNGEEVYQETPYDEFTEDTQHFRIVTKVLSENKHTASINYMDKGDLIDHITMSDELFNLYIDDSATIYEAPLDYIPDFESSTSDHLPVWAKFDMAQ
ncbi:hypothetical protein LQ318_05955 [Aliifodinibius salicampi]|uniref:Endonuclease/exonuclease/phosphatase domain-containing protein n=1 Tax=Fodinibius salicampi TaxID=1920655 RepID=A0ABT3PX75_9BACT|nr:endonuclease/exonuclease/phosphatase family protein [Fodinibius salicampi]MCW9712446.1 hypothetical protein [Fodinibius salicampi]